MHPTSGSLRLYRHFPHFEIIHISKFYLPRPLAGNVSRWAACPQGTEVKKQICFFGDCKDEVCEADKESPDHMHFCQKHHDQLEQYVKDNAVHKIVGFWVRAMSSGADEHHVKG